MSDFDIKVDESGWKSVLKQMEYIDQQEIEYGYVDNSIKHPESGESIVDIAAWNNDGVKKADGSGWHIPPRSFMDMAALFTKEDLKKYSKLIMKELSKHKDNASIDAVYKKVGSMTADQVRKAIDSQQFPALAPATVIKKGSSVILKETNTLYRSADYKINKK